MSDEQLGCWESHNRREHWCPTSPTTILAEIVIFTPGGRSFNGVDQEMVKELTAAGFAVRKRIGGGGSNLASNIKVDMSQRALGTSVQEVAQHYYAQPFPVEAYNRFGLSLIYLNLGEDADQQLVPAEVSKADERAGFPASRRTCWHHREENPLCPGQYRCYWFSPPLVPQLTGYVCPLCSREGPENVPCSATEVPHGAEESGAGPVPGSTDGVVAYSAADVRATAFMTLRLPRKDDPQQSVEVVFSLPSATFEEICAVAEQQGGDFSCYGRK